MSKQVRVTTMVSQEALPDFLNKISETEAAVMKIRPVRRTVNVEVAAVAYRLLEQGHAVRDISRHTGVSKSTVSRIGRNPENYGLKGREPIRRGSISEEIDRVNIPKG